MMDAPKHEPNIEELLDAAVDDNAQLVTGLDAPVVLAEEIRGAIQGAAVRAVLEHRIEQLTKRGHTAETDAMLPIDKLPRLAREQAQMAIEVLGQDDRRDIAVAKRRIARAAAILLAAYDRLNMIPDPEGRS